MVVVDAIDFSASVCYGLSILYHYPFFSIHLSFISWKWVHTIGKNTFLFLSYWILYRHRANARCCKYECLSGSLCSVDLLNQQDFTVCVYTVVKWTPDFLFTTILHLCPTCCVSFYPLFIPSFTSPTCDIILYTYFTMLHQSCVLLCVFYYNAPHMIKVLMAWDIVYLDALDLFKHLYRRASYIAALVCNHYINVALLLKCAHRNRLYGSSVLLLPNKDIAN